MRIREIVYAMPLVFGIACSTSSTQGSRTARTDEGKSGSPPSQIAGAPVDTGPRAPPASGTYADPTTGSNPNSTWRQAPQAQQGEQQAQGQQQGASASNDVKAHSDDQVVSGKIGAVSAESITIMTDAGDQRTLHLVPQTSLSVNGRDDAQATDLAEGLPVRASYNTVGDQDVAVDVRAGTSVSGQAGQGDVGLTPGTNTGAGKTDASSGSSKRNPVGDSPTELNRRR